MRKIKFASGEYYHLFNRGVDKRIICDNSHDYQRLQSLLYLANDTGSLRFDNLFNQQKEPAVLFSLPKSEPLVAVHAYSLMPNHFHMLVQQKCEGGISKFMQRVGTAYTMYYNTKSERTGSLFQGTFKAVHIDTDRYLRYVFAYIHANSYSILSIDGQCTIDDALAVLAYPYSSIGEYQKIIRPENSIIDMDFFEKELGGKENLIKQLEVWLAYHAS